MDGVASCQGIMQLGGLPMSIVLGIILSAAFWIGPPRPLPQPLQRPEKPLLYCFSESETSDDVTAYFCKRLAAEGRKQNRFDVSPSASRRTLK